MSPKDTIPVREGEELDLNIIEDLIRQHISGLSDAPLEVEQFFLGSSNLTYQLRIGDWEAVLRRPPHGPVAPKAHDMEREYNILKEINPHFPVAPKPYFFYPNEEGGKPFFVMERKKGIVLDSNMPEDIELSEQTCRSISQTMVDHLVKLHEIDYTQTNLNEMTKPEGFLERQVHGWINRYEQSKTDHIAGVDELTRWMANHIPKTQESTIIHYDYKLNNIMFDEDDLTKLIGLFDWEMTTVGDPLADLGVAMSYWQESSDSELLKKGLGNEPITTRPGFMTREEFIEAYAKKSGRDVTDMNFYQTFAYFKLAVICQQIYYRWKKGQTQDQRFSKLNLFVENLIEYALYSLERKV
ncbi:phosphotransferase family protein [Piscibacillus halophilus]|uniref:Predicted kinase, aminoglycoside phosphotransferase (APT) family n=1 Tax=Piscibacillus halophilus TaxID=571933 RepID=A0A1H9HI62_9BACI|nr:phosphotransferase family protein [Piscibacillus halophilus]SEQ61916.1 Predicted kinase, aminoglycoside phosphotransferase (APT) family [Piscibacillus halophilus]